MRAITWVVGLFLRNLVRNRANLVWMLVFPVLFLLVIVGIPKLAGNTLAIAVVDMDRTPASQALMTAMAQLPGVKVSAATPSDTDTLLRQLRASVVLTVPKGFQAELLNGQPVNFGWDPSGNLSAEGQVSLADVKIRLTGAVALAEAAARTSGAADAGAKAASGQTHDPGPGPVQAAVRAMDSAFARGPAVAPQTETLVSGRVQAQALSDVQRSTIGMSLMFIVFTLFGSTSHLSTERQRYAWQRVLASPVRRRVIMTGYMTGFFIVGWIQFAILYATARWLLRVTIPLGPMQALLIALFILATTGLALCVSTTVRGAEQHMGVGAFIAVSTSMLGGAYWPIDVEPVWLQHFAWFVPQSWALQAFQAAAMGLGQTPDVGWSVLVLAAFAVAFCAVGIFRLQHARIA